MHEVGLEEILQVGCCHLEKAHREQNQIFRISAISFFHLRERESFSIWERELLRAKQHIFPSPSSYCILHYWAFFYTSLIKPISWNSFIYPTCISISLWAKWGWNHRDKIQWGLPEENLQDLLRLTKVLVKKRQLYKDSGESWTTAVGSQAGSLQRLQWSRPGKGFINRWHCNCPFISMQ